MTIFTILAGVTLLGVPLAAWLLVATLAARTSAQPSSRSITRVGLILTVGYAAVSAIGAIACVIDALVSPNVQIDVPVQEYWPTPPGVEYLGEAQRVAGGFNEANLTLGGLSLGVRALLALSIGIGWLIPATLAAVVAVAFVKLRNGDPFAPILINLSTIAGVVVGIGGLISVVSGDFAGSMAAGEALNGVSASGPALSSDGTPIFAVPQPRVLINLPIWPIGAILGFGAVSTILRRGQSLEQDSKGLI